eukprot:Rmarinus@m.7610
MLRGVRLINDSKHNTVCFYETLGVQPDASAGAIRQQFYKLAKKFHPDSGLATSDAQKFHALCCAFQVLRDEDRRKEYDRWRSLSEAPSHGTTHATGDPTMAEAEWLRMARAILRSAGADVVWEFDDWEALRRRRERRWEDQPIYRHYCMRRGSAGERICKVQCLVCKRKSRQPVY